MRYKLHADFSDKKDFLLEIEKHFNTSTHSIHKARNEIKIIDGFVVKSFKIPHIINRFAYSFLRGSKAKKSYLNALKIADFTPKPLGYIEFFSFGLLKKSYFISEQFAYDFTIKKVLEDTSLEDRETILKAFVSFSYDLHQHAIFHLDYSPGNILIKKEDKSYHFKLVDINRMKFLKPDEALRAKSFAKLSLSNSDSDFIATHYAKLASFDKNSFREKLTLYNKKHQAYRTMKKNMKRYR